MSMTEHKKIILEGLWKASRPLRPKELYEKLKIHFPALMMHLVGLKRLGYVDCPDMGYYVITNKGKEVLGFPPLTQQLAKELQYSVPNEKAFYFFDGIGNYLGVCASSLEDFCQKIRTIDVKSVEFHIRRRDFETWFNGIGDYELATRISLIEEQGLNGEELRQAIHQTVEDRCHEIKRVL